MRKAKSNQRVDHKANSSRIHYRSEDDLDQEWGYDDDMPVISDYQKEYEGNADNRFFN